MNIMPFEIPELNITLPGWMGPFISKYPEVIPDMEGRMQMVIDLSLENVNNMLGGPFAAAVFDEAGKLVAPGVNMVLSAGNSVLHAEIVALMVAQKKINDYDLSRGGLRRFELYASTEPCAMCFGAICWSGISRLVCGAKSEDAEAIGFDEGPRHPQWISELTVRGIEVVREVSREKAVRVHRAYVEAGGVIYNP
jgi:tRNA(Arg) A34 adenosine deaminase TadA